MTGLEILGHWLATTLLEEVWNRGKLWVTQPPELEAFEKACGAVIQKYPDLFPSAYTTDGLRGSEEQPDLLEKFLRNAQEELRFPTLEELLSLLTQAWRDRRDALPPAEAAEFFRLPEDQSISILRELAVRFYRELAKNPDFRDPLLVTAALKQLEPTPPDSTPGKVVLVPINGVGMNVVLLGAHSDEPNGQFFIRTRFHLLVSRSPMFLRGFEGIYWAYGCPCLNSQPTLTVDGETVDLQPDWEHLRRPLQFQPGAPLTVAYVREQRPPLMRHQPADCDYGDLTVNLRLLSLEGEEASARFAFRFEPGGQLERIEVVRPVPRLADEEMKLWRERGEVPDFQYERLMQAGSVRRYMTAMTDNPTLGSSFGLTDGDVGLLRRLLESPPPVRER